MRFKGSVFRRSLKGLVPHRQSVDGIMPLLQRGKLLLPLGLLCLALGGMLILPVLESWLFDSVYPWRIALTLLAFAALLLLLIRLRGQLLGPLAELQASLAKLNRGDHDARLPLAPPQILEPIVQDMDNLTQELNDLYEDMDNRISRHTTRLAQKTASLKILYDVAASINQGQDLDELLIRFLRVLREMVNGLTATVRVVQADGNMRLVGSIGMDDQLLKTQELLPLALCQCGATLSPGDILCDNSNRYCSTLLGRKMYTRKEVEQVNVPLDYHAEHLGMYRLYVLKPGVTQREDILQLLDTMGTHLGMAVAKQRSDEEARRLSIMQERNAMAHELHDSLAQTLASLRFQVRMMEDSLPEGTACNTAAQDLLRIRHGIDEAHMELRELLNSFRAPIDGRNLSSSLEKLVQRVSHETGVAVYFQQECKSLHLASAEEMQMLRIVQEALANIRKHARAQTVRVLLSCHHGAYVLLIEDDGVGFEDAARAGNPGEHVGLSIMEERAHRLGATLTIESEPGEGTRVELIYKPVSELQDVRRKWVM